MAVISSLTFGSSTVLAAAALQQGGFAVRVQIAASGEKSLPDVHRDFDVGMKILEHRAQLAGSRRAIEDHDHSSPSSSHAFRSSPRFVRASRSRWPSTEPAPIASSRSSPGTVAA
jgi:hypothetical protein